MKKRQIKKNKRRFGRWFKKSLRRIVCGDRKYIMTDTTYEINWAAELPDKCDGLEIDYEEKAGEEKQEKGYTTL